MTIEPQLPASVSEDQTRDEEKLQRGLGTRGMWIGSLVGGSMFAGREVKMVAEIVAVVGTAQEPMIVGRESLAVC